MSFALHIRILPARLLLLAGLGLFTACASDIQVEPEREFPRPLVEPMDIRLGVHYTERFQTFTYDESEDSQGLDDTTINMGSAQLSLFRRMLPAMFRDVVELAENTPEAATAAAVDVVLVPAVADFEYAVPRTNKAKVYEVWIKYQFDLRAADGEAIASWAMPAYGKTPTAMLTSYSEALNQASLMALRDCGAAFVTSFEQQSNIDRWLETRTVEATETVSGEI